jgi:hypothetical protein
MLRLFGALFYLPKGVIGMNPSMKEQLQKLKQEKPPQKKPERLSERDLKELVGMDRTRYGRAKGGAFRQK